ncbi:MAG: hypothetical protein RR406_02580 [Bacilli bacterium]
MIINEEESKKMSEMKEIEELKAKLHQKEKTQKIVITTIAGTTLAIFLLGGAISLLSNKNNKHEAEPYSNSININEDMKNSSKEEEDVVNHLKKDNTTIDFDSFKEFPIVYKYSDKGERSALTATMNIKRSESSEETILGGENFAFLLYKDAAGANEVVFINMKEYIADRKNCHEYISGTTFDCTTLLNPLTKKFTDVTVVPFLDAMSFIKAHTKELVDASKYLMSYILSVDDIYDTIDEYYKLIGTNELITRHVPNYEFVPPKSENFIYR